MRLPSARHSFADNHDAGSGQEDSPKLPICIPHARRPPGPWELIYTLDLVPCCTSAVTLRLSPDRFDTKIPGARSAYIGAAPKPAIVDLAIVFTSVADSCCRNSCPNTRTTRHYSDADCAAVSLPV